MRDLLRGRLLPDDGPHPHGLQLRGARIVGRIDLDGITTTIPLQLLSCYLPDGLDGRGCVLPSLGLDRSMIALSSGDGEQGAVRLEGARITGELVMSGATLINEAGPAMYADFMTVSGGALLDGTFTASGHGEQGAVCLLGADITGPLVMAGATLINEAGPALHAERMTVGGGAFLYGAFIASGHGEDGAVRLTGAHITGQLVMRDATLTNAAGPALLADWVTVDGNALLDGAFTASGHGELGAVRLEGARVAGQLGMSGATLTNEAGPALYADRVTVGGGAFLDGAFTASGHSEEGAVRLLGARIAGPLVVDAASVDRARTGAIWVVDGLTYDGFPSVGFDRWLVLLRFGTPAFRPQPYQQLVAAARAAGYDDDARRAQIAQRDDQVERDDLTPASRAWARFTKVTLGYGYQPGRALLGVAAVLFLAVVIVFFTPGALARTPGATACTGAETFQIAVDMSVPFVSTSAGTACHITDTPGGQFVAWASVFLTFAGWALTALFAARAVRTIGESRGV